MPFSAAIDIWVKSPGKKLRRSNWKSSSIIRHVVFKGDDNGRGRLEVFNQVVGYLGYSPTDEDMFADDWEEVAS